MSDDQKPRPTITFANGVRIPCEIVDIVSMEIEDELPKLRDEVSIEFGDNGEISTMNGGEFYFECHFDGGADVFDKLKKLHDDDIAKQERAVENN